MKKYNILNLFVIVLLSGCLDNMSDRSLIELASTYSGTFRVHGDSLMHMKDIVFYENGDIEQGIVSSGIYHERVGKWVLFDRNFRIKEMNWYSNGKKYFQKKPRGSEAYSYSYSRDSLNVNFIKNASIRVDTNSFDKSLVNIVIFSADYPCDFMKFNTNLPLKESDFDWVSNEYFLRCRKSGFKENSFINVLYRDDEDNIIKRDSINLGSYDNGEFSDL